MDMRVHDQFNGSTLQFAISDDMKSNSVFTAPIPTIGRLQNSQFAFKIHVHTKNRAIISLSLFVKRHECQALVPTTENVNAIFHDVLSQWLCLSLLRLIDPPSFGGWRVTWSNHSIPFLDKGQQFDSLSRRKCTTQRKFQLGVPAEWSEFKDTVAQRVISSVH